MQARLTITTDTITPDLSARLRRVKDRTRIHRAMGMAVVSIAKRAFNSPSLRPSAWAKKKDGTPSTLRDTGTLAKSPRIAFATHGGVTVGSDRYYAAIHQLGGSTPPHVIRPVKGKALNIPGIGLRKKVNHPGSKIPARPYFPFDATGKPTRPALEAIARVVRASLDPKGKP